MTSGFVQYLIWGYSFLIFDNAVSAVLTCIFLSRRLHYLSEVDILNYVPIYIGWRRFSERNSKKTNRIIHYYNCGIVKFYGGVKIYIWYIIASKINMKVITICEALNVLTIFLKNIVTMKDVQLLQNVKDAHTHKSIIDS